MTDYCGTSRLWGLLGERIADPAGDIPLAPRMSAATVLEAEAAAAIGISLFGAGKGVTLLVDDPGKKVGNVRIQCSGQGGCVYLANAGSTGQLTANLRIDGDDTLIVILDAGVGYAHFPIVSFRSHRQFFYWGPGSTAVNCSVELEGEGRGVVIGGDALMSSGIWIRNHDMHSIVDLHSGAVVNPPPGDVIVESHVWIGQDVLLLGAQHVGYGAILGARALVKAPVPPCSAMGGTPARVLKSDVSWGRATAGISADEKALLERLSNVQS